MEDKIFEDKKENSSYGLMSMMLMAVPILVSYDGKEVDDILNRILEIRKQPKEMQAEHASDLVADMTKKATRTLMEDMQKGFGNGLNLGEVQNVRE